MAENYKNPLSYDYFKKITYENILDSRSITKSEKPALFIEKAVYFLARYKSVLLLLCLLLHLLLLLYLT